MSRSDGIIFLNDKTRAKVESIFDKEISKHDSYANPRGEVREGNIREILSRLKAEVLQI